MYLKTMEAYTSASEKQDTGEFSLGDWLLDGGHPVQCYIISSRILWTEDCIKALAMDDEVSSLAMVGERC
jgi:hypothetical protein